MIYVWNLRRHKSKSPQSLGSKFYSKEGDYHDVKSMTEEEDRGLFGPLRGYSKKGRRNVSNRFERRGGLNRTFQNCALLEIYH